MQLSPAHFEQIAAFKAAALSARLTACDCARCGSVVFEDAGLTIEEGCAVLCDGCAADECERALS